MSGIEHRRIDPSPFAPALADLGLASVAPGPEPELKWIELKFLVVEPAYQRGVFDAGRKNIVKIARAFEWTKFAPVIVCALKGGLYAIVDGQHRTTAAAARGIRKVPCQVIKATPEQRAAAFAAVNGAVTKMSTLQLHVAMTAAGDPDALAANAACAKAGVRILPYPLDAKHMKSGDTLAAAQIPKFLRKYGEAVLVDALRCITKTAADGNVGLVRGPVIEALCANIEAEPDWCGEPLLRAMRKFDLRASLAKAFGEAGGSSTKATALMVDLIAAHLDKTFRKAA